MRCDADDLGAAFSTGALTIREILRRMRHDGCDGLPGKVELLTGIEGRIVLRAG